MTEVQMNARLLSCIKVFQISNLTKILYQNGHVLNWP